MWFRETGVFKNWEIWERILVISMSIFMGIELFLWVFLWLLVMFDICMSMMLFLWAYHSINGIETDSPG